MLEIMSGNLLSHLVYILGIITLSTGLFIMITSDNYIRKIIGLSIFQSSVLIFYIALGKVAQGIVPIDVDLHVNTNLDISQHIFSSPLPHVLMLTAIVVGFATMSVSLALILQIKKEYNSISESQIQEIVKQRECS